jgi:hypothetical protein
MRVASKTCLEFVYVERCEAPTSTVNRWRSADAPLDSPGPSGRFRFTLGLRYGPAIADRVAIALSPVNLMAWSKQADLQGPPTVYAASCGGLTFANK